MLPGIWHLNVLCAFVSSPAIFRVRGGGRGKKLNVGKVINFEIWIFASSAESKFPLNQSVGISFLVSRPLPL